MVKRMPTPDQRLIEHLGAAVLLCWTEIPVEVQKLILDQANDTVGIVPVPDLRDQIREMLSRRTGIG
jgi:hypothetical protein